MHNSIMHELYHAHNVKMPTIVDILTFVSMINTTSATLKQAKVLLFQQFSFNEMLKLHAQVNWA